jgi:hypothetical protein
MVMYLIWSLESGFGNLSTSFLGLVFTRIQLIQSISISALP